MTNHEVPDVCVPVGRACDNPVGVGRPVDPSHTDVVLVELRHRGVPEMAQYTFERSFTITTVKKDPESDLDRCYRAKHHGLLVNST